MSQSNKTQSLLESNGLAVFKTKRKPSNPDVADDTISKKAYWLKKATVARFVYKFQKPINWKSYYVVVAILLVILMGVILAYYTGAIG